MKKTLIFSLILAMLLSCFATVGVLAEGEAQPISTTEEFEQMSPTGNYYLTQDIDFGGKSYENYIVADFSGTLDGKGYSLRNFSLTSGKETKDSGIFGYLAAGGATTIQNLTVGTPKQNIQANFAGGASCYGILGGAQNSNSASLTIDRVCVYADIRVDGTGIVWCGGFIGKATKCIITNCEMHGSVFANSPRETEIGGFAGYQAAVSGRYENCCNYADISVSDQSLITYAGGILGRTYGKNATGIFNNCVNFGNISQATPENLTATSDFGFGGILGRSEGNGTQVDVCANYGSVSSPKYAGGLCGYLYRNTDIRHCLNYGFVNSATSNQGAIYGDKNAVRNDIENQDHFCPPSGQVKVAATQSSAPLNGRFNIRFIGTVDSLEHSAVGLEITVYYQDQNGKLALYTFEPAECSVVYEKMSGKAENGIIEEKTAEELGGTYAFAATLKNCPAVNGNRTLTFVVRSYTKDGETTVYGDAGIISYSSGEFLSAERIPTSNQ